MVEKLDKDKVQKVLEGDVNALFDAFSWGSTPQGVDYWCDRAFCDIILTDDDRAFLQSLLEQEQ